jgi:acetyl-CoA C-acetyltransferase
MASGSHTASDVPIADSSGLQQIVLKSARAKTDRIQPWLQLRLRDLKPSIAGVAEARTGLSVGKYCEVVAKDWNIGRFDQHELVYRGAILMRPKLGQRRNTSNNLATTRQYISLFY